VFQWCYTVMAGTVSVSNSKCFENNLCAEDVRSIIADKVQISSECWLVLSDN